MISAMLSIGVAVWLVGKPWAACLTILIGASVFICLMTPPNGRGGPGGWRYL